LILLDPARPAARFFFLLWMRRRRASLSSVLA
jgi:hypothetical protein